MQDGVTNRDNGRGQGQKVGDEPCGCGSEPPNGRVMDQEERERVLGLRERTMGLMNKGVDPGGQGDRPGRKLWTTTPLAAISTGCRTKEYGLRDDS